MSSEFSLWSSKFFGGLLLPMIIGSEFKEDWNWLAVAPKMLCGFLIVPFGAITPPKLEDFYF